MKWVTSSTHIISRSQVTVPMAAIELTLVIAGALLLLTGVLYLRDARSRRRAHQSEDERKLQNALESQRVTSLRNEALHLEIRERQKTESKLKHLAYHDLVTGLFNRTYLTEQIQLLLENQQRSHHIAALLYIDLDNFKTANDRLGHRHGDALLQEIGQRIQKAAREDDIVARVGGDEFGILVRNTQSIDRAYRLAQRLLTLIEEPAVIAGISFSPTASIGLCRVETDCTSPDAVLRNVDLALYRAKREGGSRVVIFDQTLHEEAMATLRNKEEIKMAVRNKEFLLYYQPLIDMRDHTIYGVEALIRWQHPRRGIVTPAEFIPVMEASGQIVEVGAWAMQQAFSDFCELQRHSEEDLLLSVNVSARQLEPGDFGDVIQTSLESAGLAPSKLQLEITESVLATETPRIGALFHELRSQGIKIAFDDFGTGYSSLSYMHRYPIDTLKIDQSFVRRMKDSSLNRDIIRFIVQLAQASGSSVVAEGVETAGEEHELLSLGCSIAQGYLFSRPIPLDQMIRLLQRGLPNAKRESRAKLFRLPARMESM